MDNYHRQGSSLSSYFAHVKGIGIPIWSRAKCLWVRLPPCAPTNDKTAKGRCTEVIGQMPFQPMKADKMIDRKFIMAAYSNGKT